MITQLAKLPLTSTSPLVSYGSDLEKAASRIVELLRSRARRHLGTALWIQRKEDGTMVEIPGDLFSGTAGIAVTLALQGREENCPICSQVAIEALAMPRRRSQALLSRVSEGELAVKSEIGGGFAGIGSWVYTFARISLIVDDPKLAEEARDLAALITPEQITRHQACGLKEGVAGLLIALLTAHHAIETHSKLDSGLLPSILACGERLREFLDDRGRPCHSGLGSGLSGIAYALTRLYDHHPDGDWHWDAQAALAQERSLFEAQFRAWKDPDGDGFVTKNAWCHGAAGMLLARSAMVAKGLYPDDPKSQQDLEIVLAETRRQAARRCDDLCCGNLGQALILQQAGLWLNDSTLLTEAQQIGRTVARRCPNELFLAETSPKSKDSWIEPGLMTGLAGIGYALLRLSRPSLPFLMLLE